MDKKLDELIKQLEPKPEIPIEAIEGLLRALELWMIKNHPSIRLYNIPEVAELLKCTPRTIKGLIHKKKELRYLVVGREIKVRYQDIEFFIEQRLKLSVHDDEILK